MAKFLSLVKLLRPHHYIKNLLVFAPVFFAGEFDDFDLILRSILIFIIFSLTASIVYIINDYKDIAKDREHPKKKNRPLASGKVTKPEAVFLGLGIAAIAIPASVAFSNEIFAIVLGYFLINLFYSFGLKNVALVDIFIIAIGFVLRVVAGSVAADVSLSKWIVILIFLGAIFIALAKRRDDVVIFELTGNQMRKSIDGYNKVFINAAMMISAAVLIVTYLLYTTEIEIEEKFDTEYLYLTSAFVIFGILRYMQITFVEEKSGSPIEIFTKDRWMLLCGVFWILTFGAIIYL